MVLAPVTYRKQINESCISIRITEILPKQSTFYVSGVGVQRPDEPRVMPTVALTVWINSLPDWRDQP